MVGVIAHRGEHTSARENSLEAFRAALAAGADGVELDVRLDRRGVPLLAHDAVQWHRWIPQPVAWCTHSAMPFLTTVDAVLAVLAADRSPTRLVLDVKRADQAATVSRWCRDRGADLSRIALWCRNSARVRELAAAGFAETALLSNTRNARTYVEVAVACGADAISLHPHTLTPEAVRLGHERGLSVYTWITDAARHRQAIDLGVDALVTDWVAQARRLMSSSG